MIVACSIDVCFMSNSDGQRVVIIIDVFLVNNIRFSGLIAGYMTGNVKLPISVKSENTIVEKVKNTVLPKFTKTVVQIKATSYFNIVRTIHRHSKRCKLLLIFTYVDELWAVG